MAEGDDRRETEGAEEPLASRVVAPPRAHGGAEPPLPSRVLSPPRRRGTGVPPPPGPPGEPGLFALLGAGLGAAVRNPWVVLALGLARLLRLAAGWTPALLLVGSLLASLLHGQPPAPGTSLSLLGLYVAGTLAGWLVELAVWAGGVPGLASAIRTGKPGSFTTSLAATFPRLVPLAVVWIAWQLVWVAGASSFLLAGARFYGQSFEAGVGGFWTAAAFAFVTTFFLLTSIASRWIFEVAIAWIGTRGGAPLAGLYEAASLLARRLPPLLGCFVLLGIVGAVLEQSLAAPLALLKPSLATAGVWLVWQIPLALAAAFVSVWRMGALVRAVPGPLAPGFRTTGPAATPASSSPAAPAPDAFDPL